MHQVENINAPQLASQAAIIALQNKLNRYPQRPTNICLLSPVAEHRPSRGRPKLALVLRRIITERDIPSPSITGLSCDVFALLYSIVMAIAEDAATVLEQFIHDGK